MKSRVHTLTMIATVTAVAFVVSCSRHLQIAESIDMAATPVQVIDNMFAIDSENGKIKMRVESDKMERYDNDSSTVELFLGRFALYSFNDEGLLETIIVSDKAEHFTGKKAKKEYWLAIGDVTIQNVIKQETVETDSLYYDRIFGKIDTDCYVKMYSRDGLMQGYGLHTDDKGSNSVLGKPFNSYGVVVQDTTAIIIDSVNFIGPFLKK